MKDIKELLDHIIKVCDHYNDTPVVDTDLYQVYKDLMDIGVKALSVKGKLKDGEK